MAVANPYFLFCDFRAENVYRWCSRFSFVTSRNEIFQIVMVNSTKREFKAVPSFLYFSR